MRRSGCVERWKMKKTKSTCRSRFLHRLGHRYYLHRLDCNGETGTFLPMLRNRLLFLRIYGGSTAPCSV